MLRPDAKPKIFLPHLRRRFPISAPHIQRVELLQALLRLPRPLPKNRATCHQEDQQNYRGYSIIAIPQKDHEEHDQRYCRSHVTTARQRHSNAREHHHCRIAEANFSERLITARDRVGQSNRQHHLQKPRQMIWAKISARSSAAIRHWLVEPQYFLRVSDILKNSVERK